jgi:hypothetical protein
MTREEYARFRGASVTPRLGRTGPAPATLGLYKFEKLPGYDDVDPIGPTVAVLARSPAASFTVDGLFSAEPVDSGTHVDGNLTLETVERILAAVGYGDDGESTDEWTSEGQAAASPYMPDQALLSSPLARFRGEVEARLLMVESVARGYSLSPEAIKGITGRPCRPGKRLIPPGHYTAALAEKKRAAVEAAEQVARLASAAAAERARPRDLRELGLEAIRVRQRKELPVLEALKDCGVVWDEDGEGGVLLFPRTPGLELPESWVQGVYSVLPSSTVFPAGTSARALNLEQLRYVLRARKWSGMRDDLPIESFTREGLPIAEQLIEQSGMLLYACLPHDVWKRGVLAEQIIRGLRCRPDTAIQLFINRQNKLHAAETTDYFIPATKGANASDVDHIETRYPGRSMKEMVGMVRIKPELGSLPASAWGRKSLETACVNAIRSGAVQPGALLPSEQPTTKHAVKKDKR